MGSGDEMTVEVVYALPGVQALVRLTMPTGKTARQAVEQSGLFSRFPELVEAVEEPGRLGIFGKVVSGDAKLKAGDRVEIYRPLTVDPKEARRRRVRLRAGKKKP